MRKKFLKICLILVFSLIFIDIIGAETYNNYDPSDAISSCGNGLINKIPSMVPKVVSIVYNVIQVAVPIVLVIMGSLDLFKGIIAQKEDEMKKGTQIFIKRLISAVIIFFVFMIVKIVISLVSDETGGRTAGNIIDCAECFINNKCD